MIIPTVGNNIFSSHRNFVSLNEVLGFQEVENLQQLPFQMFELSRAITKMQMVVFEVETSQALLVFVFNTTASNINLP